jgi:threonine/homoserine/homoserine lactone efflux protein
MPESSTLLVFTITALALLVVPGPSVLFIVARTVEHGRTAGLVSVLGIEAGALVHVAAAVAGVTTVATSETVFTAVRWVGAAYLVALGVQSLRRAAVAAEVAPGSRSRAGLLREGMLVDLLNPKTAIFFVAFLPQFIDPANGSASTQALALGTCFLALAGLCDASYALITAALRARLRLERVASASLARATCGIYIGLAAVTVLT